MSIREAILKAADYIEQNPGEFDFYITSVPDGTSCGTPGCALGWIACFAGIDCITKAAAALGWTTTKAGGPSWNFYMAMDTASGDHSWQESASTTARALRLYADKYHPAKPVVTPNWSAIASAHPIPDDVRSQELTRA